MKNLPRLTTWKHVWMANCTRCPSRCWATSWCCAQGSSCSSPVKHHMTLTSILASLHHHHHHRLCHHHNHYCHRDGQTRFPAVSSSMASLLTPWNMRQSFSSSETFISLLLEWWASYTKKTESHQRKWQRKNLSWVFRPRKRLASTRALLGQELLHRAGHHCHLPLVHYWTWHLLHRVFPQRCFCPQEFLFLMACLLRCCQCEELLIIVKPLSCLQLPICKEIYLAICGLKYFRQ